MAIVSSLPEHIIIYIKLPVCISLFYNEIEEIKLYYF